MYPTIASQFNDPGVTWMFTNLCRLMRDKLSLPADKWTPDLDTSLKYPRATVLIPGNRVRYLAEIAEQGRGINERHRAPGRVRQQGPALLRVAEGAGRRRRCPSRWTCTASDALQRASGADRSHAAPAPALQRGAQANSATKPSSSCAQWPALYESVTDDVNEYKVRDKTIQRRELPRIAQPPEDPQGRAAQLPRLGRPAELPRQENLPGHYPYTGGVYPYRRTGEDPTRMFAGEGTPERTNRRFHYLSQGGAATRLSTAFDSVTLYGEDPAPRPDIYGKIGNSGVNIATLDDMKKLYSGFDLSAPSTSVSMTINGPAPMILAMFMNTAIDQNVEKYLREDDARWAEAQKKIDKLYEGRERPQYLGELPEGNDGLGLGLLGVSGDELVDAETYARIKTDTLTKVRGTVQADILKEDQAQNTCIFSTEFALRMMGDIQQYFVDHKVRNFYSVSISGYHIAEAGANPISQLAFTLSNGFTIVEYYLARGMNVDDFAPNLSFFFSNGMDPEYTVIGRVARRIWARAMRERYGASARSQMMKYHIQTSGRSLHAQEIQFNDIRTTLQAMYALFDNCNSLHTNAYDEAITTPTEESVRRAVAIQMIINKELGPQLQREPVAGQLRRRHADRPGRGGGVQGVRGDQRARRRAWRDGYDVPARQDPGRVDVLRAQEA